MSKPSTCSMAFHIWRKMKPGQRVSDFLRLWVWDLWSLPWAKTKMWPWTTYSHQFPWQTNWLQIRLACLEQWTNKGGSFPPLRKTTYQWSCGKATLMVYRCKINKCLHPQHHASHCCHRQWPEEETGDGDRLQSHNGIYLCHIQIAFPPAKHQIWSPFIILHSYYYY